MKRLRINFLALLFIGVLCILSSCSKESLDGESGSAAVVWDKTSYNVSYVEVGSPYTSFPVTDEYFILHFALEDSENHQKRLSFSCTNYIYGEKVDLTTGKYSSQIDFKDGQKTYWMKGGDSNVKAGSYYKLTRKGNHIELTIELVYSGDNGYEHTLKVRYSGELPENSYFPSENWQNEPSYHYTFSYDEAPYSYSRFASYGPGGFICDTGNEKNDVHLRISTNNETYGEKIDLTKVENDCLINLVLVDNETGTQEWYEWYSSSIQEGSYFYIKKGKGSSKDELTIDIRCKDKDGTVHHIKAEYNVYK